MAFYYLLAFSFTDCAGQGPKLGDVLEDLLRGDTDGGEEVGMDAICKSPSSQLVREMERFPRGLKARRSSARHPHAEGALTGAHLLLRSHLILGSNASQQR